MCPTSLDRTRARTRQPGEIGKARRACRPGQSQGALLVLFGKGD
jgi:hypothetical protein